LAKLEWKSALKLGLKVCLSALAIFLVFSKIELAQVWKLIQSSDPLYLLLALLFFNISKWISSLRLLKLFRVVNVSINWNYNLRLYYLGMFYNLFLPGGIGGDGYKIYHLGKIKGVKRKDLFSAVLLDRISGAALLAFLALAMALFSNELVSILPDSWYHYILILGAIFVIPSLIVLVRIIFSKFKGVIFPLVHLSFWVQIAQLVCAGSILLSFGVGENFDLYCILFLVSSIAAMLPISFGGIGLRELVFLYASQELPINETSAVALGLTFFLITALSSFVGVFLRIPANQRVNNQVD